MTPPGAGTDEAAILVRGLGLSIDGTSILEDVDLTVPQGDFVGVIGPNGGGKTMLLKVLLGLIRPDTGTVRVLGRAPERSHGSIGYVPQHAEFDRRFPIRVVDVVRMGRLGMRRAAPRTDRDEARLVSEALARLRLDDLAERQIGELSGGQLQRVLIARALAMEARLLLLDEPMSNLDSRASAAFYDLLSGLAPQITVVLVAHDVGVMYRRVRSIVCLNRRLHAHTADAPTQEILDRTYGYPVDVLLHEHRHRVLAAHERNGAG